MNREPLNAATSNLQRLAPWAGIAFAVLLVAGFFLVGDTPDTDDKQAWVDFYDDSDNRVTQIIGGLLGVLSAFAFLWFAHSLIARLAGSRSNADVLSNLARSAATLFAAFVILAMVVQVSISAAVELGDAPGPDTGDFGIQFEQLAFGLLLVAGCLSASLFIATVSELARQRGVWPRWLIWAGFVAALLLLLGVLFFPIALIPLWALAVSIVLLMRPPTPEQIT